jgi:hypothetical protein
MKKKLAMGLWLAALATPASGRNAEDYWCGKGNDRIHLLMWIAKVQEPTRDDEGKLIRDDKGNLLWGRAAFRLRMKRRATTAWTQSTNGDGGAIRDSSSSRSRQRMPTMDRPMKRLRNDRPDVRWALIRSATYARICAAPFRWCPSPEMRKVGFQERTLGSNEEHARLEALRYGMRPTTSVHWRSRHSTMPHRSAPGLGCAYNKFGIDGLC